MSTELSVNLNAIAQLRNRRDVPWPSVRSFGRIALTAGACGLTVHPRPDQRHIRFSDLPELKALIKNEFPDREFNIEGYPTEEFMQLVEAAQPEQITLVPDDPAQATSDHGWDFRKHQNYLTPLVSRLKANGSRVALFADADPAQMKLAASTGCDRVELYTGPYGAAYTDEALAQRELDALQATAEAAQAEGMLVNAGHDLTVANLPALIKAVPFLAEVSIGHAITADALEYGLAGSVERYRVACTGS
ncbi:MAG: pyridoxine 5'-phosphate synthase [Granulosicoccus sp.]